jgi:lysyl-tRNA synthetase class 1
MLLNPVWHVHNGIIPKENTIMTFSMLLNLVEASNANSKELLWKFVKKYKPNILNKDHPIFDKLIEYAIKYFNDVIKVNKKYKEPDSEEKKALEALVLMLDKCTDEMQPEEIQTQIYSVGKENGYKENLRDWFKLIYEVVFGDENGPRMGFFISFFGVRETQKLIKDRIN